MGWKTIHNRNYYYRSQRIDDSVRCEYAGKGAEAEVLARLDALQREQARAKRADDRRAIQLMKTEDAQIEQLFTTVEASAAEVLRTVGLHQHKGQWRKKRQPHDQ